MMTDIAVTSTRVFSLLIGVSMAISCGDRPLPGPGEGPDGGPTPERWAPRLDIGGGPDRGPWPDRPPRMPDGCARPAGYCNTDEDCPQPGPIGRYECRGCYPDPCCPMCAVCVGQCEPVKVCANNAHCDPKELCNLDGICFPSGPLAGTCEARPQGCPEIYDPVCGCDKRVYGNGCEAHAMGVSVKNKGLCNEQACLDLENQYVTALASAKTCCPACALIQCTLKVKDQLRCSCETFVEATQPAAKTLQSLEAQWVALGCDQLPIACPDVMCAEVLSASCQSTGSASAGQCQDLYGG